MADVTYNNRDLNRFWLSIIADSALNNYNALSPSEAEIARLTKEHADRLDALAQRARQDTGSQTAQINTEAYREVQDVRKIFINLLERKVTEDFHLDVKPAILNCCVNLTERYLSFLSIFMKGQTPQYDPLAEEVFWLPIFTMQSRYIRDNIGYFEKIERDKAENLARLLNEYYSFSIELEGIISRIGEQNIRRMANEHHAKVMEVLRILYEFMAELIKLQQESRIPGSMSLVYLDRSRRMICFSLIQLAVYINAEAPHCDPYAQRISSL